MLGNLGTFRLQIVDIDYYLAAPGILDKPLLWPYNVLESSATQVPVIRIFGNTESQQSACLHIHQAWPYIYVPYNGKPDYDACIKYGHGLGISLNEALNVAQSKKYGAHISDDHQTLVLGVIPVKAISVYGYYDEYDPFFKIVLANPGHITLAACLLTSGAVLGTKTQVFEAHIPYLLHFMIDHNLYGMNYIELDSIKFRQGLPDKVLEKAHFENHLPWTESSVPDYMRWVPKGIPEFLLKPSPPERMTSCSLEADALGRDVLNANKIKERRLGSHKIKPSKEDRPDKYVPSLGQIWKDIKSMDTENEMSDVFSANNNSNSPQSREIHENKDALNALEMGAILKKALEIDRSKPKSNKGAGNDRSWFDSFPTAFGALSSLYPQAWAGGGLYQEFMKSGTTQVMNDVDARDFSGPRLPRLLRSETTIDESIVMGIVNENSEENDDLEEDELDGLWLERENDGMESGRHTESGSAYGTIISPKSNKTNKQIGNVKEANIPQFDGPGDLVPNNEGHINSTAFKRQKKSHRMPRDFLDNSHKVEEDANVVAGIYESNARVPFSFNIKEMWSPKPNSAQEGTAIADNLNPNRSELPSLLESPSAPKRVQVSRKASRIAVRDPCPQKAEIKHVDHGLNKLLAQAETATTSTQDKSPKDDSMPSMKSGTCASDNHEESHQVYRTSQPIETDHLICPDDNVVYTIDIGIPSNSFVYGESAPDVDTLLNSLPSHAPRQPSESQDNLKPFNPNLDTGRIHNDSKLVNVKGIKENCGFNIIASKVDATTDALKIESKDIQRRLAWWKIDNELAINRRSFSSSGRLTSLWKGMLWEPSIMPPLYHDAERWLELENKSSTDKGEIINVADLEPKKISTPVTQRMKQLHRRPQFLKLPSLKSQDTMTYEASQIIGITPKKPFMAIQYPNIDLQTPNSRTSLNMHKRKGCYFSYISMELHAEVSKPETFPHPKHSEIKAIVCSFRSNSSAVDYSQERSSMTWKPHRVAVFVISDDQSSKTTTATTQMSRQGFLSDAEWNEYENELDMVMGVAKWVCSHDPDVLLGYDFHSGSWGFLVERMSTKYKIDISPHLSRILQTKNLWKSVKENSSALDDPNVSKHNRFKQSSHGFLVPNVPGRLVISMWQIARKEYHLQSYSLESVAMHALKQSIPHYPYKTLSRWYKSGPVSFRQRVVSYVCQRTEIVLQLLEKSGVVPRTVEFSMIYGTDYYSTLTRGSQFKVESMMVRISRPENLLMLSPGPTEVKKQPPPSHIPLVLEPQRLFFTDPVVVLDFQSLYPSILIAYNYCYSTCLGKLEDFISNTGNSIRLGFTDYKTVPGLLEQLRDQITVAPNNAVFVKSSVRKSLLSRLLSEVLDTRVMVKEFMKKKSNGPESESLMQQLNSRQLGLKLLSNVVGGYIAASHTGRMPCVDIADAMILTARRTLEHSIKHITANHHRWGGEVIGGDTDSVFIHFPGKTKNQAFEIGAEIAQEITDLNPSPIKLKFERVYKPCIMFAKKRYAGFAFEKPDQKEPIIDCKGIETVQRITCRASHKIIESTLMRVFSGQELHQVKRYLEQQWSRILNGRVSLKDFCIYKSVRPGTYDLERNNKLPAHANVGIQGESSDGRIETGYADRVPFIIAMDQLGLGLSEHSVHPREFFSNPKLKLDAMYYITRLIIPPLDRVFNTIGVDVSLWFDSLSKKKQIGTATIHKLTRDITFSPELLAGGSSFFEDNSKASDKAQDVGDDGNPSNEVSQKTVAIDLPVQPSSDAPNPYQGLKPGPRVLNKKKVGPPKITLDRFYTASHCIVCTNPTKSNSESLCNNCRANPAKSVFLLISQASKFERRQSRLLEICQTCSSGGRMESGSKGSTGSIEIAKSCDNLNCSVLFERIKNGLSAKRSRMILSNALKALE